MEMRICLYLLTIALIINSIAVIFLMTRYMQIRSIVLKAYNARSEIVGTLNDVRFNRESLSALLNAIQLIKEKKVLIELTDNAVYFRVSSKPNCFVRSSNTMKDSTERRLILECDWEAVESAINSTEGTDITCGVNIGKDSNSFFVMNGEDKIVFPSYKE